MAVDMFFEIDDIEGESLNGNHKNQIDVIAWSWGASQSSDTHTGGGGGTGRVDVQDLSFTKNVDSASSALLTHVFRGTPIKKATLFVRKAGDNPLEFIVIVLEDVIVSSISSGGSQNEDKFTENVTLNFSRVTYTYRAQKEDGSAEPDKTTGWDIAIGDNYTGDVPANP